MKKLWIVLRDCRPVRTRGGGKVYTRKYDAKNLARNGATLVELELDECGCGNAKCQG